MAHATKMFILPRRARRGQFPPRTFQRGQSIVIALLVLLLLGLVGGLFVAIVARNLVNARHSARVLTADNYSKAGLVFADAQLTYSLDGADWRPPLQYQLAPQYQPPAGSRELARYNAFVAGPPVPSTVNPADPDAEYLLAGFTRYNTGNGRFLLRLTYDPVNTESAPVPPGRYIKIEAIGREGVIDPTDPTSFANNLSTDRTQSFQVAYKPIGITDYARFETNPDKRSDAANLGVISQYSNVDANGQIVTPGAFDFTASGSTAYQLYPVVTTYGAADAFLHQTAAPNAVYPNPTAGTGQTQVGYTFLPGGGSFHANMTTRFFGKNIAYVNPGGVNAPLYQDTMEVSGSLLLDNYDPNVTLDNVTYTGAGMRAADEGQRSSLVVLQNPLPAGATPLADYVAPSSAPTGFYTHTGLVRDGSTQNDTVGLPRGIQRLEPPLMDAVDPATTLPRYKALAMLSPPRVNPAAAPATFAAGSGQYGYGKSIYIDNTQDIQTESQAIGGGTTLTDEWLHQSAPNTAAASTVGNWHGHLYDPPGVNITLGELVADSGGGMLPGIHMVRSDGNWKNPNGSAGTSQTLDASFNDLGASGPAATSNNDIILYAEGNVRLRGVLSPQETVAGSPGTIPRHITIVTNGTAYIDGNLLKGDEDSSITVLAHDYVCVNTTQFLAGATIQTQLPPLNGNSFELDDANSLTQIFSFGLTGANTPAAEYGASNLALYVSGGPPPSSGSAQADFNILDASGTTVLPAMLQPTFTGFSHMTFDLSTSGGLMGAVGTDMFQLLAQKDPGNIAGSDPTATQNFLLDRVAVLPMDIRVEAVLYAQTRSFFVIPGDWFNTSSSDTLDAFVSTVTGANPNGTRPFGDDARFPFYGQPIDLKITIDGAVSEARPVDIAAQSAWMLKWGWIPQYHGSLIGLTASPAAEPAGHPGSSMPAIGLQLIYNPQAGYPYSPTGNYYLRSDSYGRPLPFSPKLPVSTGLLYSGESSEAPILQ